MVLVGVRRDEVRVSLGTENDCIAIGINIPIHSMVMSHVNKVRLSEYTDCADIFITSKANKMYHFISPKTGGVFFC
jgi:hypothetical protein